MGTPSLFSRGALAIIAAALLAVLPACGTVNRLKGPENGASTEKDARDVAPDDPLARPTQVGWTSARATRCGFIFSPEQLRANYLAAEMAVGRSEAEMRKIEKAYDYTRESVLATIEGDLQYCNKERTDAIRKDLNRYLAGDYTPTARMAR
ncbi:MAG: hypothetical protein ACRECX_12505 [Methyloceanibacter sp.]|uniref:hypothetical protein n=1 Tax=Methyloceanibacter sp. TaxID=1965321 RepID=UPI003D6CEAC0